MLERPNASRNLSEIQNSGTTAYKTLNYWQGEEIYGPAPAGLAQPCPSACSNLNPTLCLSTWYQLKFASSGKSK